jgi:hypothetical protein
VHPVDVVQEPVPRLADDGQAPEGPLLGPGVDLRRDERVADDADGVRVREADRRAKGAALADPLEPGQLAVAVQTMGTREDGLDPRAFLMRLNDRDAGADALAFDQRRVPDPNARDVSDRVLGPGGEAADLDAQVAGAGASGGRGQLVSSGGCIRMVILRSVGSFDAVQ